MYNPMSDSWSASAALPSTRDYHSAAILLPSGQVMVAGGKIQYRNIQPSVSIRRPRPTITAVPPLVHHGQNFVIHSPHAASIAKVVLIRPMAITHQTDGEQRALEMPLTHDTAHATQISLHCSSDGTPVSSLQRACNTLWRHCSGGRVRSSERDLRGMCRIVSERHFQRALLSIRLVGDCHRSDEHHLCNGRRMR